MISSLDELLHRSIANASLVQAMQAGIAEFDRYRSAIPSNPRSYSRMLLRKTPEFELVAMQWVPSCASPIHDHGDSRCWVVLLDGTLEVENFERLDDGIEAVAKLIKTSHTHLAAGQLDHRLNWRELHRVANTGPVSAFSLQLYAAPQSDFMIVDEQTGLCSKARPVYDAVFDL